MDIQDLRYFTAVYDTGSYAKAADKMFVSRQALRQKLQRLEEEIGSPLFTYHAKMLEPTEIGRALHQEAMPILSQFQSLELNLLARSKRKKTELSVAMGQGVFSVIPYDILLDFQQLHPQIRLQISHDCDINIVSDVKARKLDFGIIGAYGDLLTEVDAVRIHFLPQLHLHVSTSNPLSERAELNMADLQGQPFFSSDAHSHSSRFVVKECRALGFEPDFRFNNLDLHSNYAITGRNSGITWSFPPDHPEHLRPNFVTIPLNFSDTSWGTYVISQAGRKLSLAARILLQYLCDHGQDV